MEKISFLDSIIKILNLIASVPFFIEILILSIILLIMMIFFYFKKSKKGKITSIIIYFIVLILLPVSHISFFASTLDKVVENFVKIIYFPSCYVYMFLLISTDISVFISILKNNKEKQKRIVGILDLIYFFVFQFLFFLIVRLIITNNIDVFERTSLYSNIELTSLIQVSSYIFWIRIGIKLISLIVNRLSKNPILSDSSDKVDKSEENEVINNINEPKITDITYQTVDMNNQVVPKNSFIEPINNENNFNNITVENKPIKQTLDNMNGISSMLDIPTIEHTNTSIKHTSVGKDYNNKTENTEVNKDLLIPTIPTINLYSNNYNNSNGNDASIAKPESENNNVVDNVKNSNNVENNIPIKNDIKIDLNSDDEDNYFDDFYD